MNTCINLTKLFTNTFVIVKSQFYIKKKRWGMQSANQPGDKNTI